tara:strand:+ start:28430 stop:30406 length:1977 start_codon:yes stop_codon:yes gene_type:complete
MRILFHAPGLAAFRPNIDLPHLLGVPATTTDTLNGLRATHQLTGNRGNIIHAEAPSKIFYKAPNLSAFGNLAVLQKTLGDSFRIRMAAQFDIIIISMANFIRPTHDGATLAAALDALDGAIKFIVLGAGLQGTHKLRDMMPGNRNLLAIMNEQAAVFGVRGDDTAEWLADNGFGNTSVLGCPSLYSYPQSILAIDGAAARAKGANADVMTAGHLALHKNKLSIRGSALVKALKGVNASYVMQDEFLTYGDLADTPFLYHEGSNTCQPAPVNSFLSGRGKTPVNFRRYYYFTEAGAWRQGAMRHDVFVGDRFHGGVAAMQAGVPAVFLKQDNRVSELTRFFDLPNLTITDFNKKGLAATLDEHLSHDALERMKTTYRTRHAAFSSAMAAHGLAVKTRIGATDTSNRPFTPAKITGPDTSNLAEGEQPAFTELDNYIIHVNRPPDTREVVITFEAADWTIDRKNPLRRGFGEKFLIENGYAVISVLTKTVNWYRAPGLLSFFEHPQFRKFLASFDRIHSYGSSMGGYGACAFADLLGCHNVVALQPVSSLATDLVSWESRFAHGAKLDWTGAYRDAATGITTPHAVYALYDPDWQDARHTDRLAETAGARLRRVPVPKAEHAVPRYLQRHKLLKDVSLMCLRGTDHGHIASQIVKRVGGR